MCLIYGAAVLSLSSSPSLHPSFPLSIHLILPPIFFLIWPLKHEPLTMSLTNLWLTFSVLPSVSLSPLHSCLPSLYPSFFFHLFLHSSLIHVMRRGRAHWVIHFNHNKQAQISALSRNDLHRRGRRRGEARRGHNCQKASFFSVSSEPVLIFRLTLSLMRGKFQTFDFYRAMKNMLIQNRKVTLHLTHSASFKL